MCSTHCSHLTLPSREQGPGEASRYLSWAEYTCRGRRCVTVVVVEVVGVVVGGDSGGCGGSGDGIVPACCPQDDLVLLS